MGDGARAAPPTLTVRFSTINRSVNENCVQTRSGTLGAFAAFAHILEIIVWRFCKRTIERTIRLWHGTCLPSLQQRFSKPLQSSWHTAEQSSEANQLSLQKFHGGHEEDI